MENLRRVRLRYLIVGALTMLIGCTDPLLASDAGSEDGGARVDGSADAGLTDAGPADAGPTDAGPADAGLTDAGPADAGPTDAGPTDAGPTDAGIRSDAGPASTALVARLGGHPGEPAVSTVFNDVALNVSGEFYVTGSFRNTLAVQVDPEGPPLVRDAVGMAVFLAKFRPGGDVVWVRIFDGMGDDAGLALAVDPSGDVYMGGYFGEDIDLPPSGVFTNASGERDGFVAKFAPDGRRLWAVQVAGGDVEQINDIAINPGESPTLSLALGGRAGSSYSVGEGDGACAFDSGGTHSSIGLLALLNTEDGSCRWSQAFIGDDGMEEANAVTFEPGGDLVVTGQSTSSRTVFSLTETLDRAGGNSNVFVGRYTLAGESVWVHRFGGVGCDSCAGLDVAAFSARIYVVGHFDGTYQPSSTVTLTSAGQLDGMLHVLGRSAGRYQDARALGGSGDDALTGIAAAFVPEGSLFVTGSYGAAGIDIGGGQLPLFGGDSDILVASFNAGDGLPYRWSVGIGGAGSDRAHGSPQIEASGSDPFSMIWAAGHMGEVQSGGTLHDFGAGNGALHRMVDPR